METSTSPGMCGGDLQTTVEESRYTAEVVPVVFENRQDRPADSTKLLPLIRISVPPITDPCVGDNVNRDIDGEKVNREKLFENQAPPLFDNSRYTSPASWEGATHATTPLLPMLAFSMG